jgi:hypothetical protein
MSRLDAADELIDSVCALIQGEDVAGDNQKALRDADILATIEEALKRKDELIPDSGLITETGKKIAGELRAGA